MMDTACLKCGLYNTFSPELHRAHNADAIGSYSVCDAFDGREHLIWTCVCGYRVATATADAKTQEQPR